MLKNICPHCKKEIEISEDKLGEVVTCDSCEKSFRASRIFVSNADPVPSSSSEPDGKDTSHADISAEPLSDGKFREIEYYGTFYSLPGLRRLRKCFAAFVFLFTVQVCCFIALFGSIVFTLTLFVICFLVALLIFIPLFVVYLKLLKALQVFGFPFVVSLALYWFVPFVVIVLIAADTHSPLSVVTCFFLPLVSDLIFRLYFIVKANRLLNAARILLPGRKPFIKMMKRYSCFLIPLFVVLLFSAFFFGSVSKEAGLCKNCGIWTDRDSICFLGMNLFSSSEYKPTAFSKYLDPEQRCTHHAGKTSLSKKQTFILQFLGVDNELEKKLFYHSISAFPIRRDYLRGFLKDYGNIREKNSYLYRFLCEKDSPDYARRLISFDLTAEEEEEFLRLFDPDWNGEPESDLKDAEGIRRISTTLTSEQEKAGKELKNSGGIDE